MTGHVVVLGAGSIGKRHIANLLALGVPPAYIHIVDPHVSGLRMGLGDRDPTFSVRMSVSEALDGCSASAFLICSPAAAHAGHIREAIERQVPFLVEKPATLGRGQLTESEWRTPVPHVVGYNWRFHESYRRAAAMARASVGVELVCRTDMASWPGSTYADGVWECSHELDLAVSWLGPVRSLDCTASSDLGYRANLSHWSGQRSTVAVDWVSQAQYREVRVVPQGGPGVYFLPEPEALDRSYVAELEHFLRVAAGAEHSLSTLAQAAHVTSLCEAIKHGPGSGVLRLRDTVAEP